MADADGLREYVERLADWQLKALREAKLATDWTAPNLEYEDAVRSFLYYDHGGSGSGSSLRPRTLRAASVRPAR